MARRIEVEAGIDRQALLKGILRTIEGQQYTAPFYEFWKDQTWQSEDVAKVIASRLEPLLLAAAVGSKKRMWLVIGEILETLERCRIRFNLQRPIDAFLAKQRPPIKWKDLVKPLSKQAVPKPTVPRKRRSSSRRRKA